MRHSLNSENATSEPASFDTEKKNYQTNSISRPHNRFSTTQVQHHKETSPGHHKANPKNSYKNLIPETQTCINNSLTIKIVTVNNKNRYCLSCTYYEYRTVLEMYSFT